MPLEDECKKCPLVLLCVAGDKTVTVSSCHRCQEPVYAIRNNFMTRAFYTEVKPCCRPILLHAEFVLCVACGNEALEALRASKKKKGV